MFHATVDFHLDGDCVLSEVTNRYEGSFGVSHEAVLDDERVRFVIRAGDHVEAFAERFAASPQVTSVERLDGERLLVTKRACGALPVIRANHGMIQGMDRVDGRRRVFDFVVFRRDDLRNIIAELREIGTVSVTKLGPYDDWLDTLSARQAEVVETALRAGYYEWPRRVDAQTLAADLGVSHATLLEHLRKAERKLIGEALSRGRRGVGSAEGAGAAAELI
jgi:predicted DNA binding protein